MRSVGGRALTPHPSLVCGLGITKLPVPIGRLTALKILDVDDNQLTDLPPIVGLLTDLRDLNRTELLELGIEHGETVYFMQFRAKLNRSFRTGRRQPSLMMIRRA